MNPIPKAPPIELVWLTRSEVGLLSPLFDRVWPGACDHEAYVDWAFHRAPNEPLIVAGIQKEAQARRAIAARGSIRWPLVCAPHSLRVCQFQGTCVDPDYQRQGLFTRTNEAFLAHFTEEGGDLIFNVSVHAAMLGYQKLGWRYLPGFRRLIRVIRPSQVLFALLRYGKALRGQAAPVAPQNRGAMPSWSQVAPFLAKREEALRWAAHTEYTPEFYVWRFSGGHVQYGWVGDGVVGYAVYRMQRRAGLKEVLIGDLWPGRYSRENLSRLFALVAAQERPALMTLVLSRRHPVRKMLRPPVWIPDPKGDLNFGVRPVSSKGRSLLDPERWALAMADIDTF